MLFYRNVHVLSCHIVLLRFAYEEPVVLWKYHIFNNIQPYLIECDLMRLEKPSTQKHR